MAENERYYVVMKMCRWADMETNIGLATGGFEGSVAMLPIYKTWDEAKEHFPDAKVMMIQMAGDNSEVKNEDC